MFKGLVREFREFAIKGNVVDLAVGLIIGGAFGKIVSSLVADVIMPPVGALLGGVDFSSLKITIKSAADGAKAATLNYGAFIQTVVDFLIVAGAVFVLVKAMNTIRRSTPPVAEVPRQEQLLEEIRDILKTK